MTTVDDRDYCWQTHLVTESVLHATSACCPLSAHYVTVISHSTLMTFYKETLNINAANVCDASTAVRFTKRATNKTQNINFIFHGLGRLLPSNSEY
jgi:hypothetical protein